jgi:hypothetical protein
MGHIGAGVLAAIPQERSSRLLVVVAHRMHIPALAQIMTLLGSVAQSGRKNSASDRR